MKTINLKGKDYVQVVERLKEFNKNVSDGRIETTYEILGDRVIFTAFIYVNDQLKATGHGLKDIKSEFNLEKCETRAIGRALGIFGIGADNSISTYDEVKEAIGQEPTLPPPDKTELIKKAKLCYKAVTEPTDKLKQWLNTIDTLTPQEIVKGIQKINKIIQSQECDATIHDTH